MAIIDIIIEFVIVWLLASVVATALLWLIFKPSKKYSMDLKSIVSISLKTICTFLVIEYIFEFIAPYIQSTLDKIPFHENLSPSLYFSVPISAYIAYRLFEVSGMEDPDAVSTAVKWGVVLLILRAVLVMLQ